MRAADFIGALAVAALLALPYGLAEWLGDVEDRRDESIAAQAAVDEQRAELRRERAALSVCAETYGENSVAVQTADGFTRCATKRGHVIKTLSHYPVRKL